MNQWFRMCFFIAVTLLVGCESPVSNSSAMPERASLLLHCENPRPQMCTRQYDPVCAKHVDGRYSTQSNACSACSNTTIAEVYAGECPVSSR